MWKGQRRVDTGGRGWGLFFNRVNLVARLCCDWLLQVRKGKEKEALIQRPLLIRLADI